MLVAVTWACNLRCSYCFVREADLMTADRRMSRELARRVVDALDEGLTDVAVIDIHFYGGEPLTNLPAIEAMVDRATQHPGRFTFSITTNGTYPTSRVMELLDRGRFGVVLSVDGPAAVHDECRRTTGDGPSHHLVMQFLSALRAETGCRVRASSVVRSGWGLAEASSYLLSLPVEAIKAQAVRGPAGTPFALGPEERAAYLADLETLGFGVIADLEAGRVPRDDRFSNRVLQLLARRDRVTFCGAGDTTFGITPNGGVLPCVLLDEPGNLLGHISDDPTTWVVAGRRWKAELAPSGLDCDHCDARDLCGGGCPAIMPVCGVDECEIVRKNCDVARSIHAHFADRPEALLALAGIT